MNDPTLSGGIANTENEKTELSPVAQRSPRVEACDFRRLGNLTNDQVRALSTLHQEFAQAMTNSLRTYLRNDCEVSLTSAEQINYGEFLSSEKALEYAFLITANDATGHLIMLIDVASSSSFIELLLGSTSPSAISQRALTEIDQRILHRVVQIIVRQLEQAWERAHLKLTASEQALKPAAMSSVFSLRERLLSFNFNLRIAEVQGKLTLLLPFAISHSLLRSKSSGMVTLPHTTPAGGDLRKSVLSCPFALTTAMTSLKVTVRDLISLKPGSVLKLHVPVRTPCSLLVENQEQYRALPVRSGGQRAAQILSPVQMPSEGEGR